MILDRKPATVEILRSSPCYEKKLGNPYFVCSSPTYPLCDENVSYPIPGVLKGGYEA